MFELKINHLVLDCAYCQQPSRPDQIRGQAYTVGEMKSPQSFRFFSKLNFTSGPCSALAATSIVVPAPADTKRHVSPTAVCWTAPSLR